MISEILTFVIFVMIGLEIRNGLNQPRAAILPTLCALSGMIFPALIFNVFGTHSSAWAVAMPTDVALAVGALSILGKRVNPAIRLFLLTLAVADDFFSLIVIGIFFRSHLDLVSSLNTLGAALIGFLLPYRKFIIKHLLPATTFVVIPAYIAINLLAHLNFSLANSKLSVALITARVVGKVFGITLAAWIFSRFTFLKLPRDLNLNEIAGVGLLAGMGLTVSLVLAKITLSTTQALGEVRIGLFIAALVSGLLGLAWLRFIA